VTGERPTYNALAAELTRPKRQPDTAWLAEVDSGALRQAPRDLDRASANCCAKRARPPRFASERRGDQTARIPQRVTVDEATGTVRAPEVGAVRARLSRPAEHLAQQIGDVGGIVHDEDRVAWLHGPALPCGSFVKPGRVWREPALRCQGSIALSGAVLPSVAMHGPDGNRHFGHKKGRAVPATPLAPEDTKPARHKLLACLVLHPGSVEDRAKGPVLSSRFVLRRILLARLQILVLLLA
jgi:hypothetical protein